jgi:hypothetical protein
MYEPRQPFLDGWWLQVRHYDVRPNKTRACTCTLLLDQGKG